ncbi:MAG TPA: CocE/NonD family hydrolase [Steroidobacteraceae bacterium]
MGNKRSSRVRVVRALAVLSSLWFASHVAASDVFDVVPPVREAQFKRYERFAEYAPVRDGTRLAVTRYVPAGGPAQTRFPTLLWYLPGHRESVDPKTAALHSAMSEADLAFFTGRGYVVAIAEMRGSGASFGWRELDRGPQIGKDGKDLVEWIVRQPWSDGRVGMIGASYQGFSQYATAAERPRGLLAIFPEIAGFDDYTSMFYPGGILNISLSQFAPANIVRDDLNYYEPSGRRPRLPSAPVVDEDGDGELADEIPLDKDGDGDFLDEGPPTYRDGVKRSDIYYRATLEHRANSNLTIDKLREAPFRDSKLAGTKYSFADIDPAGRPAAIASSGIAVYNRGGWFDYHARDTTMWFATLHGRTPTRLMMVPTAHGGLPSETGDSLYRAGPYLALFNDKQTTNALMNREKLRFFDHYVLGLDNGFDREPPVLIYVMGKGWRRESEWPLARERRVRYAFDANGRLSETAVAEGADEYRVDFRSSTLTAGANRWNFALATATKPMSLDESAPNRLRYDTEPLATDVEVTGHPIVELVVSSTAPDSDFFVYLEDVAPDGSALLVTEGQLRANFHRLQPNDSMLKGRARIDVKPELPWQGFRKKDYVPAPFANGKTVRLKLDLMPTSWVFKRGHRIRVSLTGADHPSFALHPQLSRSNDPNDPANVVPTWSIKRGPGMSAIELPVIPEASD